MTAILIDARRPGLSGWISVRKARRVRVQGLEGGTLRMMMDNGSSVDELQFRRDSEKMIPPDVISIRVKLEHATELTRLHVDLEE